MIVIQCLCMKKTEVYEANIASDQVHRCSVMCICVSKSKREFKSQGMSVQEMLYFELR